VDSLLERLNQIVYTDFPTPRPYTNIIYPPDPPSPTQDRGDISVEVGKPDSISASIAIVATETPSTPVRNLPPVPLFADSSAASVSHVPESLPPSQSTSSSPNSLDNLPAPLVQLLQSIVSTIQSTFINRPPHTIQRLAELILNPQKHYKTLPAWLRAVDRVVNVSSSADIFPLSENASRLVNGVNGDRGGGILWKNDITNDGYDKDSLGSDESLGGALLTPIPWLRNTSNDSADTEETRSSSAAGADAEDDGLGEPILLPSFSGGDAGNSSATMASMTGHSDPLVLDREDGAVTQGELIRMEQEAGVVPVATTRPPMTLATDDIKIDDLEDLVPHARGPDVIGAVDMGKVDGRDLQVRLGSPPADQAGLDGASESKNKDSSSSSGDSTFEIVGKEDEDDEDDAMQVDTGAEQGKA
jgi:PPP4R2